MNAINYLFCFKKDALQMEGISRMSHVYFPLFGMAYIITGVRV